MAVGGGYSRLLPSRAAAPALPARPGWRAAPMEAGAKAAAEGAAEDRPGAPVTLHIYHVTRLGAVQRANGVLGMLGAGGAYHAAVEVYGREWSFGATEDGSSGVFCCQPQGCADHAYLKAEPMGFSKMSEVEVLGLIGRLAKEWQGEDYDLLRCNCCHFSDDLLRQLGLGPAPRWLMTLAGAGAAVEDQARAAAAIATGAQLVAKDSAARLAAATPRRGGGARAAAIAGC